jgi:hypothetical protein
MTIPDAPRRTFLFALLLAGCAVTAAGVQREAVQRVEDCVGASQSPFLVKDDCVARAVAYCADAGYRCNPQVLWDSAHFEMP